MIIFCSTRRHAEDMSREINLAYGDGTSKFYHAGLERDEKTQIEKWFFDRKDAVLCATCAFGMGVDKSDIRTVVHLDPPATAESYIQEAGRGGRDRNVANAIMLWNYEDSIKTRGYEEKPKSCGQRIFFKQDMPQAEIVGCIRSGTGSLFRMRYLRQKKARGNLFEKHF